MSRLREPVPVAFPRGSGANDRRPGLDQLLRDVKARKIDLVVVAAFDRFGRSVRHLVECLDTASGRQVLDLLDGLHAAGRTLVVVTPDRNVGRRAGRSVAWSATRRPGSAVDTRRRSRHPGGADRP